MPTGRGSLNFGFGHSLAQYMSEGDPNPFDGSISVTTTCDTDTTAQHATSTNALSSTCSCNDVRETEHPLLDCNQVD